MKLDRASPQRKKNLLKPPQRRASRAYNFTLLIKKNFTVLLVGSKQVKDTVLPIMNNCPKAKNYIGKSRPQLMKNQLETALFINNRGTKKFYSKQHECLHKNLRKI